MPRLPRFTSASALFRGAALTVACLWLTLPAEAEAQPRLTESALSAPMLAESRASGASSALAMDTSATIVSLGSDSQRWVRAKMVRQWGMMMLVEALAFTALLAWYGSAQDEGYPFERDAYGCGGRAAPIATAAVGAVGLALTIKGTFGMRRHVEGRPVRFGSERRPIRRWSPLLAAGAIAVAGALVGSWFADTWCNS
jgi:hypothetical protein